MRKEHRAILAATKRHLEEEHIPNAYRQIITYKAGTIAVRVSQPSISRALRILTGIVAEVECRGWKIIPKQGRKYPSLIAVGGENVGFALSEATKRVLVRRGAWPEYRYDPVGLCLHVTHCSLPDDLEKRWSDGNDNKIEDLISGFADGVFAASVVLHQQREEHEAAERRAAAKRQQREEVAVQQQRQEERRRELFAEADAWQRAKGLRALIAEVRRVAEAKPQQWQPGNVTKWLSWAEAEAAILDPFQNGYFRAVLGSSDAAPIDPE